MSNKNCLLQVPRPAGGFARRVPLPSESERARPNASAPGLCRNGSIRRSATFHRKPPRHAMFSYDQMYPWQYFARRGSSLLPKSKRACPSAFATFFCRNATIHRGTLPQKTVLHAMFSYDQDVSVAAFCTPGFSLLLSKNKRAYPNASAPGLCPNGTICHPASSENRPGTPCTATTGCIRGNYFTRRGFPSLSESEKSYPSASAPGLRRNATIRRGTFPQKTALHAMFSYDQIHPLSPICAPWPVAFGIPRRMGGALR